MAKHAEPNEFPERLSASMERHKPILDRLAAGEVNHLVPGFWCQELQFGWLPGSSTACTVPGHHHVSSDRNPLQPEHAVIADWQKPVQHRGEP